MLEPDSRVSNRKAKISQRINREYSGLRYLKSSFSCICDFKIEIIKALSVKREPQGFNDRASWF